MKSIDSATMAKVVHLVLTNNIEDIGFWNITTDEARIALQSYRVELQGQMRDASLAKREKLRALMHSIDQAQKWLKTASRSREDQLLSAIRRHKARILGTTYYVGYEGPGPDQFNDDLWRELEK